MSIGTEVKVDRAWKLSLDKAMTAVEKAFYEELYSSGRIVHKNEVWKDDVDSSPSQAVADGVAEEKDKLVLTEITSVSGKRAWVAESAGERIMDWISPKFGQGYTVQLFDQDDNQIYTTDVCNWVFDYKAGILFLEFTKPGVTGFKLSGYVYCGDTGVGLDSFQEMYNAGPSDAIIKLDANGKFEVQANDETPLLKVDEVNKRVEMMDLIVSGTLTKVQTTDTEIKDNIITLNKMPEGQAPPSTFKSGIEIDRGTLSEIDPTLRWNNEILAWEISGDAGIFRTIAVQGGTGFTKKHIETVSTPTLQVTINNVHELINVPGATVQIYEPGTGDSWVEILAQVKWSSDWHTVQIYFEENFTGRIILVG